MTREREVKAVEVLCSRSTSELLWSVSQLDETLKSLQIYPSPFWQESKRSNAENIQLMWPHGAIVPILRRKKYSSQSQSHLIGAKLVCIFLVINKLRRHLKTAFICSDSLCLILKCFLWSGMKMWQKTQKQSICNRYSF